MLDRMCAAPRIRRTEFQIVQDPVTHVVGRQFGLCGPTASSSALSSALGREVTVQETYTWMRNHYAPIMTINGASTLGENQGACEQGFGAAVAEALPFHNPTPWSIIAEFLRAHAGIDPIVYETSNGQAQVDSISTLGENAKSLQFHFPAGLGYHSGGVSDVAGGKVLPEGIWVADGCNFAGGNSSANGFNAADVLQFYTFTVLQAAALVGMFALKGRDTTLQITQVGNYYALNADGSWHCKTNGKTIRGGMLDDYKTFVGTGNQNGFSDFGLPLTDEIAIGPSGAGGKVPTIQVFERKARIYDPNRAIDNPPGEHGNLYSSHLNRPEVLEALGAVLKSSVPVPAAPVVTFGAPAVHEVNGAVTVTLPYSAK